MTAVNPANSLQIGVEFQLSLLDLATESTPIPEATSSSWNAGEVNLARDVTFDITRTEIDANHRGVRDWNYKIPGMGDWSVTFDMVHDPKTTIWRTIRDAFMTKGKMAIRTKDSLNSNGGPYGFRGGGYITNFSQGEPMDDLAVTSVTFSGSGPLYQFGEAPPSE